MLVFDFREIGNKLLQIRKKAGLTQAEVAEAAKLSDRTYADIERGSVNMRIETILRICEDLHITPDEILTDEQMHSDVLLNELLIELENCTQKEKETALKLLSVYIQSLK